MNSMCDGRTYHINTFVERFTYSNQEVVCVSGRVESTNRNHTGINSHSMWTFPVHTLLNGLPFSYRPYSCPRPTNGYRHDDSVTQRHITNTLSKYAMPWEVYTSYTHITYDTQCRRRTIPTHSTVNVHSTLTYT